MKTIFYKLYNEEKGLIYIGRTSNLKRRIYKHKNLKHNRTNSKLLECNFKVEILEECENLTEYEKNQKEGFYIKKFKCVNSVIPSRTRNQYQKDYLKKEENLKRYRATQKKSYDKLGKLRNERTKIQCECGGCYPQRNKKIHFRTKKHLNYELQKKINDNIIKNDLSHDE